MTDEPKRIMALGDSGDEHDVGDVNCGACWWDDGPRPCDNVVDGVPCPGLIHASFGDENSDGDYWLYTKCDVCGASL